MFMGSAAAQGTWRLVVPYPPGGGSDRAARILAEALQARLGSSIVVENVVGAGGRLALRQLASQPDSQVLVVANPALMVVAPQVYRNNGYDPERDFQPLSQISTYEFAVAVAGVVPVREATHLMAWMRANPSHATLGVPATGSLPHFFALMMGDAAQVPVQVVGYKGSAPLATDLIGGHVPAAVDSLESLLPFHEAGKLRILATSGNQRSVSHIPTFKESGLHLTALGWNVVYAKSGMPAAMADKLARDIAAVMTQESVRQQFMAVKVDPVSMDRASTRKMLQSFKAQWVPAVRAAGVQFD
jgi:tripartite-type tricarboxylate transporter receptor subunit TctC